MTSVSIIYRGSRVCRPCFALALHKMVGSLYSTHSLCARHKLDNRHFYNVLKPSTCTFNKVRTFSSCAFTWKSCLSSPSPQEVFSIILRIIQDNFTIKTTDGFSFSSSMHYCRDCVKSIYLVSPHYEMILRFFLDLVHYVAPLPRIQSPPYVLLVKGACEISVSNNFPSRPIMILNRIIKHMISLVVNGV